MPNLTKFDNYIVIREQSTSLVDLNIELPFLGRLVFVRDYIGCTIFNFFKWKIGLMFRIVKSLNLWTFHKLENGNVIHSTRFSSKW